MMNSFVTSDCLDMSSGESLACYVCEIHLGGRCLWPSEKTCNGSEFSCFYGTLGISKLEIQAQSCLPSSLCNKTVTGTFLSTGYTITGTCCSTNLCNGASSVQLPLTAALIPALTAVWSLRVL
uniref:UPAR/Ly6 domain-containing protein n=1 Tax=Stegastes partitus TaxID=144197 RepID=A0A3B4ZYB0_9TELE